MRRIWLTALVVVLQLAVVALLVAQVLPLGGIPVGTATYKTGSKARQFNGTSDFLASASSLNFASTKITSISMFIYWNAFANTDNLVGETSTNYNSNVGAILLDFNAGDASIDLNVEAMVGSPFKCVITRPSAAAWHHYLVVFNLSTTTQTCKTYVDGASVTPTITGTGQIVTFVNFPLYLFSRAGTSLFGAGRLSEFAIWQADESANVAALAAYTAASSIDAANLLYYWPIKGNSPEAATTGGINLNVTGTTVVAGPNP